MNDFLDRLVTNRRRRVEESRLRISDAELRTDAERKEVSADFPFEKALRQGGPAFICEIKKASPSKGILAETFFPSAMAKEYQTAGAAAISVLTEPDFFLGDERYLSEISREISLPTLRKDFVVDRRMIDEAKILGAAAVLLIAAIRSPVELRDDFRRADALGLSALMEVRNERELDAALEAGARIIGVNHRDLTTFQIDFGVSERLRPRIPSDILFVAESGIRTADDVNRLRALGTDAVLIGETLVRSGNISRTLRELRGES